ncbi:flavodoxin family protein [Planococcus lenghuensis]|uniref:NAD(P)H-dependent oxidoreductase n=1 Tax=Planococcus lenghuensis TaxID=2213202 RepID=A0A1Q2L357_9BACL|nr:NAD(P)H-dependent oxidoreductase [Planococcus lenghuensis]AQQ54846.1 NAD(P)H-dependent oxidoreductase [Planococcus lenghuensis]
MNIMTMLTGSRRNGNSEYLAARALQNIDHRNVYLLDHRMEPVVDMRHAEEGFPETGDDYEALLEEFLRQDVIVFAVPLYWFGMPGQLKIFFDRWTQYMRDSRFDFNERIRGKKAYVIITGSSPDPKIASLPLIQQFNYLFEYVGMEFVDYIIANGNKPEEVLNDPFALAKMDLWNEQLKAAKREDA